MSLQTEFGRLVREKRKAAGYTQQSFAECVGLSCRQLCNIERGKAQPTLATALRIAGRLEISLDPYTVLAAADAVESLLE